jgi:hypothetical protein
VVISEKTILECIEEKVRSDKPGALYLSDLQFKDKGYSFRVILGRVGRVRVKK